MKEAESQHFQTNAYGRGGRGYEGGDRERGYRRGRGGYDRDSEQRDRDDRGGRGGYSRGGRGGRDRGDFRVGLNS